MSDGESGAEDLDVVVLERVVASQERAPFGECLGDDHAVERIPVVRWQVARSSAEGTRR